MEFKNNQGKFYYGSESEYESLIKEEKVKDSCFYYVDNNIDNYISYKLNPNNVGGWSTETKIETTPSYKIYLGKILIYNSKEESNLISKFMQDYHYEDLLKRSKDFDGENTIVSGKNLTFKDNVNNFLVLNKQNSTDIININLPVTRSLKIDDVIEINSNTLDISKPINSSNIIAASSVYAEDRIQASSIGSDTVVANRATIENSLAIDNGEIKAKDIEVTNKIEVKNIEVTDKIETTNLSVSTNLSTPNITVGNEITANNINSHSITANSISIGDIKIIYNEVEKRLEFIHLSEV